MVMPFGGCSDSVGLRRSWLHCEREKFLYSRRSELYTIRAAFRDAGGAEAMRIFGVS